MQLSVFGKRANLTTGKIILLIFCLLILMGAGWFAISVGQYYRAIRLGKTNPILDQRLESSLSRLVANTEVTDADRARLASSNAPTLGAAEPKLTIVEFLDFGCPYCQASHAAVREVMAVYKDRVRLVVRDFPLEDLHPRAMAGALAARCAHEQGKYWAYHDKLYTNQDHHEDMDLMQYAREVGADEAKFQTCFENRVYQSQIEQDVADGLAVGVAGTPTFFFNGVKVQGKLDRSTLEFIVNYFLKP